MTLGTSQEMERIRTNFSRASFQVCFSLAEKVRLGAWAAV